MTLHFIFNIAAHSFHFDNFKHSPIDMSNSNWSLLSRLRTAVKKVSILLNLHMNRWRIASMLSPSSSIVHRIRSFNDRPAGLTAACASDDETMGAEEDLGSSMGSQRHLQRTISYPSDQDDVDQRAEMFIANFRRQLQIERQVSLELRYCRGNSFELASPWWSPIISFGDDGAFLWIIIIIIIFLEEQWSNLHSCGFGA